MYRLRTQNIYSEMDGTDSKVFIDKTIYPFPPEQANIVFFMDNFLIQNTETKKYVWHYFICKNNNHACIFTF